MLNELTKSSFDCLIIQLPYNSFSTCFHSLLLKTTAGGFKVEKSTMEHHNIEAYKDNILKQYVVLLGLKIYRVISSVKAVSSFKVKLVNSSDVVM